VVAGAELQAAQSVLAGDRQAQGAAQSQAQQADAKLRSLAVAAYMGLGYASPMSGQQAGTGTVSSPAGLTGLDAVDALEMLRIVGQHARQNVETSDHQVRLAQRVSAKGSRGVATAQRAVADAESALLASQQTLKIVVDAATTSGSAATLDLMALPPSWSRTSTTAPAPKATGSPPTQLPGAVNAAADVPAPTSPSILGASMLTGSELAAWFASTGRKANTTVPMKSLASYYQLEGKPTGVRYDLAFAQSVVETGYFSFPSYGQLTAKDNNFAGIGACDTCATGWSFPNAKTGVGAQLELLEAYASPKPVPTPLLRGAVGVGGCCPTWLALAGTWASSVQYGISILGIYNQMLTWVIPQRLLKSGIIGHTSKAPAARGPLLAPLPAKPAGARQ
jgi:Mannosyl-glycoprotein endo-beta-N-acetylglucosaminidase